MFWPASTGDDGVRAVRPRRRRQRQRRPSRRDDGLAPAGPRRRTHPTSTCTSRCWAATCRAIGPWASTSAQCARDPRVRQQRRTTPPRSDPRQRTRWLRRARLSPCRRPLRLHRRGRADRVGTLSTVTEGSMLEGITILELGGVIAGNYGGVILADLGAEVIKIEPPTGDTARNAEHRATPGRERHPPVHEPGEEERGDRPQDARRPRHPAPPGRTGGRGRRQLPPGCAGEAGHRPRRTSRGSTRRSSP